MDAPEAEMQIHSVRILRDRLAIFGRGFAEFVLCFENLRGKLVHPIRRRGFLEHAMGDIVECLHMKTGGLVEHVGVVRIFRLELGRKANRLVRVARGAEALHQRQAGEAGEVGIARNC